jgi:type VI secretion system protein ImpH
MAKTGKNKIISQKVMERMFQEPYQFDFFQATWLLERMYGLDQKENAYLEHDQTGIIFRPHSGLVFPPADIRNIERLNIGDHEKVRLTLTFFGLYGVNSPLPVYFYEDLALGRSDTLPLQDFLDIFNHRLYQHFYRSWKKYQPTLQASSNKIDKHSQRFYCLTGLGIPHEQDRTELFSPIRLAAFAGRLMARTRCPEGLRAILSVFFKGIEVKIQENIPRWVELTERPQMGRATRDGMKLGDNITLGKKLFDISGKFRIIMGLDTYEQYTGLLPGGKLEPLLRYLVSLYTPDGLSYDVQLQLESAKMPRQFVGGKKGMKLGLTGMLGHSTTALYKRTVQY